MHDLQVRACIKRKECTKTIWWHIFLPYIQNNVCDNFRIDTHDTPNHLVKPI